MKISTIVNLVISATAISNFILGLLILIKNRDNPINRRFAYFAFIVALWVFGLFLLQLHPYLFWGKFIYTLALSIPLSFNAFVNTFLYQGEKKRIQTDLVIMFLAFIPLVILLYNNLILVKVIFPEWGVDFELGRYYFLFSIYFILSMGWAFVKLIKKHNQSSGLKKQQIRYIFLGTSFSALIGSISAIILPSLGYSKFYNLGPASTLLVVLFTAYAIAKTQLMDIRVVIGRTLAHAIVISFFGLIYSAFVIIYRSYVSTVIDWSFFTISVIYGILVTNFGGKVRQHIQTPVDRFFIKGWYDYARVSEKIALLFRQATTHENIIQHLSPVLEDDLDIQNPRFYFLDKEKDLFFEFDKKDFKPIVHSAISSKLSSIQKAREIGGIIRPEKKHFNNTELIVPATDNSEVIAFLALGKKRSEEEYTEQDLHLLRTIGEYIAVAIEYIIKPYEEVKRNFEVTNRKLSEAEKQLERSQRLASLGTLTAGVTHEIRNPLAIIRSKSELLPKHERDPVYLKDYSSKVLRNVDRIESIIERMLAISRSKPGKHDIINLNTILESALQMVKLENVKVIKQFGKILPIEGNTQELEQVFVNLIQNSREAMRGDGTLTLLTYSEDIQKKNPRVFIEITDTGKGIPKENFEKIFDPFYSSRHEGTGLGLSIAYKFIRENNGEIRIKSSEVGHGTTFEIKFNSWNGNH